MRLQGKVSLVTGAGSGIGQAIACCFAAEGAHVVAVDINEASVHATREQIMAAGGQCLAQTVDVASEAVVQQVIEQTMEQFGRLDILVNNAGVAVIKPATETTEAELDRILNINVKGVFFGCKHAIPVMQQQGGGVIINTASELAFMAQAGYSAYCASKGAVLALTRALAVEWAKHGIRVNALCPGPIQTPLLQAEFDASPDPVGEAMAAAQSIPLGRLGQPGEIAKVALFLASDDAAFVHGAALLADGGRTIV